MKKKLFLLFIFIFIFISSKSINSNVFASANVVYYSDIKNILDLSNLEMDNETNLYNTIEPIKVESGESYTLITDRAFIGQTGEIFFYIKYDDTLDDFYKFQVDEDILFIEFAPDYDEFHIVNFQFSGVSNANLMLYEGFKDDFKGVFSPYTAEEVITSYELEIDVDDKLTTLQIDDFVQAVNPLTDDLVPITKKVNNYKPQVGTYEAIYIADASSINHLLQLVINVVDRTPPVIETNAISFNNTMDVTIEIIAQEIDFYDNHDELTWLDLRLVETDYLEDSKVGAYFVTFGVQDFSGNYVEKRITLDIFDKIAPIIKGPEAIFVYTSQTPLTNANILSKYLVEDDTDELIDLELKIKTSSYNQTLTTGRYDVVLAANDLAGNTTTKDIVVHVIDNTVAKFVINAQVTTTTNALLSDDELIDVLMDEAHKKGLRISDVKINTDIYNLNYNVPGTYDAYVEYMLDDELVEAEITIIVADEKTERNYMYIIIPSVVILGFGVVVYIKKKRQLD